MFLRHTVCRTICPIPARTKHRSASGCLMLQAQIKGGLIKHQTANPQSQLPLQTQLAEHELAHHSGPPKSRKPVTKRHLPACFCPPPSMLSAICLAVADSELKPARKTAGAVHFFQAPLPLGVFLLRFCD